MSRFSGVMKEKKQISNDLKCNYNIEDDYIIGDVIGEGAAGSVYLLTKKDTLQIFAGKRLDASNETSTQEVETEVRRLVECSSAFTIKLFACYFFDNIAWVSESD